MTLERRLRPATSGCFAILLLCASSNLVWAEDTLGFVAHVASDRTRQAALATYEELQYRLPDILSAKTPHIHEVDLGTKGIWHRLRIGPPMSEAEAIVLCTSIKAAGHPYCKVLTAFEVASAKAGFFGDLLFRELPDGHNMEVVKPFEFVDAQARRWKVPPGAITDGASIPSQLWSLLGSPFVGKFRRAAVVHDHYCKTKHRSWQDTHDMFYEAMIANGVSYTKALTLWAAVYRFGPRWSRNQSVCWGTCAGDNIVLEDVEIIPEFQMSEFNKIKRRIAEGGTLSPSALKQFIEDNTYNTWEGPTGARWKGFVSGGADSPAAMGGVRRYVDGEAPPNWKAFGEHQ